MKKISLLLGTLGGAMAGYLLSNDKLRQDLVKAKDPEAAAKLLGMQLVRDGKKLGHEVRKFEEAQKGIQSMMKKGGKSAGKAMKATFKKMDVAPKNGGKKA